VPAGTNVELPGADRAPREEDPRLHDGLEPRTDMPRYVELYRRGQLRLDEMISARLPLDRVNDALEAMRQRAAARSVLVFE
jgi:S-(hydroxymethyl)glutathione dehydrogenase / alcohol dehydrogenase